MFVMQRIFIIAVKLRHNLPEMQRTGTLKFVQYGQKTQKAGEKTTIPFRLFDLHYCRRKLNKPLCTADCYKCTHIPTLIVKYPGTSFTVWTNFTLPT